MYTIAVDTARNLVEVLLAGMLGVEETNAYIAQLRHDMVRGRIRAGYRMVIDVSRCPIQGQDMIQAMGAHMATMPKASALAVVTGSSLARMQVRRLFKQPYARIVATVADGRAWVLDGVEPPPEGQGANPAPVRFAAPDQASRSPMPIEARAPSASFDTTG